MTVIKKIVKFRIKETKGKFYPQIKGFITLWFWEDVVDTYDVFLQRNGISGTSTQVEGCLPSEHTLGVTNAYRTMFFYSKENAEQYIEEVLKPKYYIKYYEIRH